MPLGPLRLRLPSAALALACVTLAACGGSSSPPGADDAGVDAHVPPVDAAEPPIDAATCDIGPTPAGVETITGGFAVIDEASGIVPHVPEGGDAVGEWVMSGATVWVSESAAMMFEPDTSSVEGTAWAVVTDTEISFEFDTVTTLMGTAAGTIRRPSRTALTGTYTVEGALLSIVPECVETTAMMDPSGMATLEFTANADGTGYLVTRLSGAAGMTTIVWEGIRRTTP